MKENKDLEISNGAFDLTIHINKGFISTQAAIVIGCFALLLFSTNQTVSSLIKVVLFLDLIAVIFYLIVTHKKNDGEQENTESTADTNQEQNKVEDTAVSHEKSKTSSVKKSKQTIKTKVAIPNPNAERHHGSAAKADANGFMETVEEHVPEPEPEISMPDFEADTVQPSGTSSVEDDFRDFFG